MNKEKFLNSAPTIEVFVNGVAIKSKPMKFSTGSVGYNINGKADLEIDGGDFRLQVGGNLTIIGSKEWFETNDDEDIMRQDED